MRKLVLHCLTLATLGTQVYAQDHYTIGVTDRMVYLPAVVAREMDFWSNQGIHINVNFVADEDDLFYKIRENFKRHGRRATDFGACRMDEFVFERARGLAVEAIAQVAEELTPQPIVTNTPWRDLQLPHKLRHVLFVKQRLIRENPELIEKFLSGYQQAQTWMRDPANADALAEIVAKEFYWISGQPKSVPPDVAFITERLAPYSFLDEIDFDEAYRKQWDAVAAQIGSRAMDIHDGRYRVDEITTSDTKSRTGTAFDEAVAWWRFAKINDYRNYGTAGSSLDLTAQGPEVRPHVYGISTHDYYHREQVWEFGGFHNDGRGWASDGVKKFVSTDPDRDDDLDFEGDFSIWLRCSNRNTRNTVLVGKGAYDSQQGFTVTYRAGEPAASISFAAHPTKDDLLTLNDIPLGTFLDVCFNYKAETGEIHGWVHHTTTGELVVQQSTRIAPGSVKPTMAPLTIGGNREHDTNMPLHGNIECVAMWNRTLSEKEVITLTRGTKSTPVKSQSNQQTPLGTWNNVRDWGAVGDGKHDDTDAIQAAIDACVFPVTVKYRGRWFGLPDVPPKPGHGYGGGVFIPSGFYRTSRPIVLRPSVTVVGDEAMRPMIASEADSAFVWWNGPWLERSIDFKVRNGLRRRCTGVTLRNLTARGKRFGAHTMGVDANQMSIRNCRFEGDECGFVNTGFMMFSEIRNTKFHPSLWILTRQGTRFNTSTIENIVVGLHGTPFDDWAVRLEGCIQCVRLSEITLEVRSKGIYLDSYAAGVTIDIHNLWNYDTGRHSHETPEAIRVINGSGIRISNVMGLDYPANLFIGKDVRNIELSNVLAKQVIVEDAAATRPIFSNVPAIKVDTEGSMIEAEGGAPKDIRK